MANNRLTTRIILRNDSSTQWDANSSQILLKGEVGIEFSTETGKVKMKIGDGVKTWAQLPYFGGDECHVTEVEVAAGGDHPSAIAAATQGRVLNKGDIAIVKEGIVASDDTDLIQGTVTQKYQYTAYVYGETADGTAWKAMDGNYNAENVYFNEDMLVTKEVGYITLTNGQAYIPSKGKNLTEVFEALYVKEQNPTTTAPSVKLTFSQAGTYEVGEKLTPSYTATFNAGAYSYGPETNVTVTAWEVTDTVGDKTLTSATGNFDEIQVTDTTSYKITAKATHTAGSIPVTNKGNNFEPATITNTSGQIQAGSKSATSSAIQGARKAFYGAFVTPIALDSNAIRTNCTAKWHTDTTTCSWYTGTGYALDIPEGTKQVIVCVLKGKTLKGVYDKAAFGTDVKDSFKIQTENTIYIKGANEYSGTEYNVYVYSPDAALGANTYYIAIG